MKLPKICAAALVLLSLASCQSPESDGKHAAELALELRDVNLNHSYDSDEVKEAAKAYDDFTSECRKKYKNNPEAMQKFEDAFNEEVKASMQQQPN